VSGTAQGPLRPPELNVSAGLQGQGTLHILRALSPGPTPSVWSQAI